MNIKKARLIPLLLIPALLYIPARQAASWLPKSVGKLPIAPDKPNWRSYAISESGMISPDEKWYADFDSYKRTLNLIDLDSQKIVRKIDFPRFGHNIDPAFNELTTYYLSWSTDSRQIAVAWTNSDAKTFKASVLLYDTAGGVRIFQNNADKPMEWFIGEVRIAPDRQTLWLTTDYAVRAWDIKSGKLLIRWKDDYEFSDFFNQGELLPDCKSYVHIKYGNDYFQRYDPKTKKPIGPQLNCGGDVTQLCKFFPDTSLVVCEGTEANAEKGKKAPLFSVLDFKTGKLLWEREYDFEPQYSPDGEFYLVKYPDRVEMRDTRTGTLLNKFPSPRQGLRLLPLVNKDSFYSMDYYGNLYRSRLR